MFFIGVMREKWIVGGGMFSILCDIVLLISRF